jgi:hypothetical protein
MILIIFFENRSIAMEISKFFQKSGVHLHQGELQDYYPGYCEQCQMKQGGQRTILYGVTPYHFILSCDLCYKEMKPKMKQLISHLQDVTHFNKIDRDKEYVILDDYGQIDHSWKIDPKYNFFWFEKKQIYIPVKKGCKSFKIPLRIFSIMNDIHVY